MGRSNEQQKWYVTKITSLLRKRKGRLQPSHHRGSIAAQPARTMNQIQIQKRFCHLYMSAKSSEKCKRLVSLAADQSRGYTVISISEPRGSGGSWQYHSFPSVPSVCIIIDIDKLDRFIPSSFTSPGGPIDGCGTFLDEEGKRILPMLCRKHLLFLHSETCAIL